jgi:hypothetical protein
MALMGGGRDCSTLGEGERTVEYLVSQGRMESFEAGISIRWLVR